MTLQAPTNYNDFVGLASLRSRAAQPNEETLREVARQFESLFTHMMLSSMRDSSFGNPLFGDSGMEAYEDMFDRQMAVEMTRGRGLGIADMLVRQLSGTLGNAPRTAPAGPLAAPPVLENGAAAPSATGTSELRSTTPEEFVTSIWPHAQRAGRALGVDPKAIVAQAALETGWGQHRPGAGGQGDSNNLFGIKADARWEGRRVRHETHEFDGNALRRERADFRAYDSLEQAFDDYVAFLGSNPRYSQALAHGRDGGAFAEGLQAAGYATDPAYARKIKGIMTSGRLEAALDDSRETDTRPIQVMDDSAGETLAGTAPRMPGELST